MLRPYKDWIIVKKLEREEKTPGGVIIPKNAKEKQLAFGVIQAVHPNCETEELKEGMTVVFYNSIGLKFEYDGEEIIFMKHDAPYCFVEEVSDGD